MSRSSSLPRALVDAVVAPAASFAALRDARGWGWAAVALILVTQTLALLAFFGPMSAEWLVEEQLLRMGDVSPTDEAAIRSTLEAMAGNYGAIVAAGAALTIAVMMPALGLVYFIANRVAAGPRYSFVAWTRFATWTQLPLVVASLGLIALTLVSRQPDLPLSAAQFASLNALVLNLPPDHAWFNWAEQLNVFTLWSVVLAAIGMRTWVGLGWGVATLVGALPWLLVFGIWALLV